MAGDSRAPTLVQRALGGPIRRPKLTLLVALTAVALAAWSASRLEPMPSLAPMFATGDPASQAMVRMLDDFGAAERLLVLVRAPEAEQADEAQQRLLAFARRLDAEVHGDEALAALIASLMYEPDDAIGDFVRDRMVPAGLYYLDDAQFDALEQRLTREGIERQIRRNEGLIAAASPTAEAVAERVLQDPLRLHELIGEALRPRLQRLSPGDAQGAFIGDDGQSLLIQVRAHEPAGELDSTRELMSRMRDAVARAEPGALTVAYAGAYPIAELSERVIRRDMIFTVVLSVILLQVLFLIVYRGPWNFPLAFLPVAGGICAGFGVYAALISAHITPVTAASGAILAGLGVDYCIHYLSHYHTHRRGGVSAGAAASHGLAIAPALGAACVTSLIGFGALTFSRVPALQDFALIGALGLGGAFVGTMAVLPALLQVFDRAEREEKLSMRWHLEPVVHAIGRRARVSIGAGVVVAAGGAAWLAVAGMPALETDMSVMQPRPNPPMQTQARIAELFPGAIEPLPVYLEADSWPELVALAHRVDRRVTGRAVRERGAVVPMGLTMVLPEPTEAERRRERITALDAQRVVSDFGAAIEASAFDPAAYEGYEAFLRELLRPADPPGVEMLRAAPEVAEMFLPRDVFQGEGLAAQRPRALTLMRLEPGADAEHDWPGMLERIQRALEPVDGATVTGMEVVGERVRAQLGSELPRLLGVAALVVLAWLALVFRRARWVALTAIPPAICLVVVAVVMQVSGTKLNPVNLLAIPLLAGIGVDDGIFLSSIAARARRGKSAPGHLVHELAASCHAITMTTLTTLLAFGSLLFTSTPAIRSLGVLLIAGMLACWFASLFVLAPLLIAQHGRAEGQAP